MVNGYIKHAALVNVAWEAVLSGDLMRGKPLLTQALAVQPDYVAYTRRSWCNLLLGDGEAALNDQLASRHNMRKDATSTGVGVAYWYLKQYEQACNDWNNELLRLISGEAIYTDAAGGGGFGSLLWWASTHKYLGHWREIAEDHLRRLSTEEHYQKIDSGATEWPAPVAGYLLGMHSEHSARELAKTKYDRVSTNRMTQLDFYVAAKELSLDHNMEYISWLNKIVISPVGISSETMLARIETNNMDTSGPLKSFQAIKAASPNPELFRLN